MSKEAIKLTRRDFLRLTAVTVGGMVSAACQRKAEVIFPTSTREKPTPNEQLPTPTVTKPAEKVVEKVVKPTAPPTVFEPTATPPPTATVEVKPTVKSTPEVKPEATPTAVAFDVTREVEEEFNKRNGEAEVAFSIKLGMLAVWPERMAEKVGDFASFEVDPQTIPLNLGEKTRVLVDPENKKARVNLIPWYPEEDKEEVLGLFTPLLPQKLNSWEIDYLITQRVGEKEELLHLAAYDNTLVVPFITPGTIGQENWDKVMALQTSGKVGNIITAIEGEEGEKEKPVIIFLDHQGEELLRANLKTIKLEEKETVRLDIETGQYTFFNENNQEMPEKSIKLWEVPKKPIPEKPEEPLEPGEVLIGQDFIALSEEKILELLNLPENEGKITCPVNADEKTEVKIEPVQPPPPDHPAFPDFKPGGDLIFITNFKEDNPAERVLFNPSNVRVEFHVMPRDYGRDANFTFTNGVMMRVANPDEVWIAQAREPEPVKFGQRLATGFKNIPASIYEERAVSIWGVDLENPRQFIKASEFMLKYKERWVVLQTS